MRPAHLQGKRNHIQNFPVAAAAYLIAFSHVKTDCFGIIN